MSGTSKRPGGPAQVSYRPIVRDPRSDSTPPSSLEETPLGNYRSRTTPDPMAVRVASLEAEIERLRAQRATDQDHIAEMLLSLAEAEKRKADALTRATDAEHRLATTRTAMAEVLKLLEDLERREEMATGVRARTIDEARRALTSERPAPPARNSPRPPAQEAPPASVRVPVAGAAPVGFADPGPAVAAGTPVARPAPSSGPEPVADLFGELPGQT